MARSSTAWLVVAAAALVLLVGAAAGIPLGPARCGPQSNYAVCLDSLCCSEDGFCGYSKEFCMDRCHSQCSDDFRNSTTESHQGMMETESTTSSQEMRTSNSNERSISSRKLNPAGRSSDTKMTSTSTTTSMRTRSIDMDTIMTSAQFSKMFPDRSSFYTYDALIQAMKFFPDLANSGDMNTDKREIAALLAHIDHETNGLRMIEQSSSMPSEFCDTKYTRFPCVAGKSYHSRGPLQITWNYNYGMAGKAMGADLLAKPEMLSRDSTMSFGSAMWLWMSPASMTRTGTSGITSSSIIHRDGSSSGIREDGEINMPSCHEVMVGKWTPSQSEAAMGMSAQSFGVTTFMLEGEMECGAKADPSMQLNRAQSFSNFCTILGVEAGHNLECSSIGPV